MYICAAILVTILSCKKESSNTDKVYIRIANATAGNFTNFTLNNAEFGAIPLGDTSAYIRCKDVLPIPFANFIGINDTSSYIVDIVPMPYMVNGNYLLKITSDTLPGRYLGSFVHE